PCGRAWRRCDDRKLTGGHVIKPADIPNLDREKVNKSSLARICESARGNSVSDMPTPSCLRASDATGIMIGQISLLRSQSRCRINELICFEALRSYFASE